MFHLLYIFALTLHLLAMNLASALPLLAIVAQWIDGSQESSIHLQTARRFTRVAIHSLLGGSLIGLALGGVLWLSGDRSLFEILPRFTYKLYWGLAELVFSLVCLGLYLFLLPKEGRVTRVRQGVLGFLALLSATNLLYHFPPLFTVINLARRHPELIPARVGAAEFRQLWMNSYAVPLLFHFGLASVAVAGVYAWYVQTRNEPDATQMSPYKRRISQVAAWLALASSAVQLLVGTWLLLRVPPSAQRQLMGSDPIGTLSLLASILMAFGLLQTLAAPAFGDVQHRTARRAGIYLLLITLLMTAVLARVEG